MKLLQNPWVVGTLAVAGLGVVAFNIGKPIYQRRARQSAPATAPAKPGTPAAGTAPAAKAAATPASVPAGKPVDRVHLANRMRDWVQAAPTDPFAPPAHPVAEAPKGPRAVDVLKLQGIWRQTGGMVAVINRQPLTEGETVAGFTVHRIEADQVLVTGPHGLEEIHFPGDQPAKPAATPRQRHQALLSTP